MNKKFVPLDLLLESKRKWDAGFLVAPYYLLNEEKIIVDICDNSALYEGSYLNKIRFYVDLYLYEKYGCFNYEMSLRNSLDTLRDEYNYYLEDGFGNHEDKPYYRMVLGL